MDEAAESLLSKYRRANPSMQRQVKDFIDGCKYYTTGNLTWSLETARYGLKGLENESGDIIMTL